MTRHVMPSLRGPRGWTTNDLEIGRGVGCLVYTRAELRQNLRSSHRFIIRHKKNCLSVTVKCHTWDRTVGDRSEMKYSTNKTDRHTRYHANASVSDNLSTSKAATKVSFILVSFCSASLRVVFIWYYICRQEVNREEVIQAPYPRWKSRVFHIHVKRLQFE